MKRQQEVNLVCSFDISENTKTESFYEKRVVLVFFCFFSLVFLFLLFFFPLCLANKHPAEHSSWFWAQSRQCQCKVSPGQSRTWRG